MVNLTQSRVTSKGKINEELSGWGWPVVMSVWDCLDYINEVGKACVKVDSTIS